MSLEHLPQGVGVHSPLVLIADFLGCNTEIGLHLLPVGLSHLVAPSRFLGADLGLGVEVSDHDVVVADSRNADGGLHK